MVAFFALMGIAASLIGGCAVLNWDMDKDRSSVTTAGWCFVATAILFIGVLSKLW
jgi:hypothetical protein